MTERWTFGVEPLAQTIEAADLLRWVNILVLSQEEPTPAVEQLIADLQRAASELAASAPTDPAPRVGVAADGDGRVYIDHARDVGAFNPSFPTYDIEVDGAHATGSVTFPIAYEGPPGLVHGGFLGVFFDCVVQHHNCDVGVAGKTTSMSLRYRRPTPLLVPLSFSIEREEADGRIRSQARLSAGDRAKLLGVSPRRSTP